jgi:hypothetical protein
MTISGQNTGRWSAGPLAVREVFIEPSLKRHKSVASIRFTRLRNNGLTGNHDMRIHGKINMETAGRVLEALISDEYFAAYHNSFGHCNITEGTIRELKNNGEWADQLLRKAPEAISETDKQQVLKALDSDPPKLDLFFTNRQENGAQSPSLLQLLLQQNHEWALEPALYTVKRMDQAFRDSLLEAKEEASRDTSLLAQEDRQLNVIWEEEDIGIAENFLYEVLQQMPGNRALIAQILSECKIPNDTEAFVNSDQFIRQATPEDIDYLATLGMDLLSTEYDQCEVILEKSIETGNSVLLHHILSHLDTRAVDLQPEALELESYIQAALRYAAQYNAPEAAATIVQHPVFQTLPEVSIEEILTHTLCQAIDSRAPQVIDALSRQDIALPVSEGEVGATLYQSITSFDRQPQDTLSRRRLIDTVKAVFQAGMDPKELDTYAIGDLGLASHMVAQFLCYPQSEPETFRELLKTGLSFNELTQEEFISKVIAYDTPNVSIFKDTVNTYNQLLVRFQEGWNPYLSPQKGELQSDEDIRASLQTLEPPGLIDAEDPLFPMHAFSSLGKLHEAFHPDLWEGHELEALNVIDRLYPSEQRAVAPERLVLEQAWQRTRPNPQHIIREWSAVAGLDITKEAHPAHGIA